MFLDSNKKLVVVSATAKTTLNMPVTVDYVDLTSTTTTAASTQAYTNGTTAVDILVAPAASTIRKVNGLLLYERDTLAKTVKIYSVDSTPTTGLITAGSFVAGNDYQIVSVGTTDFTLIGASANTVGVIFTATGVGTGTGTAATSYPVVDVTLQVDDTLGYTDTSGWYTLDMSGNLKTVVGTSASAIADAIHTSSSKATPVDADEIGIWDSVSGLLNKLTLANLKTTLGSTFAALAGSASQVFSVGTATAAAHAVNAGFFAPISAELGANVVLNNTANYFTGPSVAQGSGGTWFASGTVTVRDTAGSAGFHAKLTDGTTVIASTQSDSASANATESITLSGYILNPAGNLRIEVKDVTSTSGVILYNATGNSFDSRITAIKIGV